MDRLKKFFLAFSFLLLFFCSVSADVFLVNPFEKQIHNLESIELGSASPGETIELIFSNKSSKDFSWSKVEIEKQLPEGWIAVDSEPFSESMVVKIKIPATEQETAQNLKLNFLNFKDSLQNESFNALVFIKKKLITASILELQKETSVNLAVEYVLTLSNDSIADHTVIVSSSLPEYWFKEKEIVLKNKASKDSIREIKLVVLPRAYGFKDFSFNIQSKLNGSSLDSFTARLKVNPTLKGKYAAAKYGFPVFTPTLFPFHLVNAFLSVLQ